MTAAVYPQETPSQSFQQKSFQVMALALPSSR
jgi:hypothetical protein